MHSLKNKLPLRSLLTAMMINGIAFTYDASDASRADQILSHPGAHIMLHAALPVNESTKFDSAELTLHEGAVGLGFC